MQEACKDQILRFGVCRKPARIKFSVLTFAGSLQGSFSPFWRLQEACKDHFPQFDVCRKPARINFSVLAFAGSLQGRKGASHPCRVHDKDPDHREGAFAGSLQGRKGASHPCRVRDKDPDHWEGAFAGSLQEPNAPFGCGCLAA